MGAIKHVTRPRNNNGIAQICIEDISGAFGNPAHRGSDVVRTAEPHDFIKNSELCNGDPRLRLPIRGGPDRRHAPIWRAAVGPWVSIKNAFARTVHAVMLTKSHLLASSGQFPSASGRNA